MSTLVAEVRAQSLVISEDSLIVDLSDGRSITVPLAWYPRLVHGTPEERNNWRWIGDREGIHWPDLDEDIGSEPPAVAGGLQDVENLPPAKLQVKVSTRLGS